MTAIALALAAAIHHKHIEANSKLLKRPDLSAEIIDLPTLEKYSDFLMKYQRKDEFDAPPEEVDLIGKKFRIFYVAMQKDLNDRNQPTYEYDVVNKTFNLYLNEGSLDNRNYPNTDRYKRNNYKYFEFWFGGVTSKHLNINVDKLITIASDDIDSLQPSSATTFIVEPNEARKKFGLVWVAIEGQFIENTPNRTSSCEVRSINDEYEAQTDFENSCLFMAHIDRVTFTSNDGNKIVSFDRK